RVRLHGGKRAGVGATVRVTGRPQRLPAGGRPAGPGGAALPARRGTPGKRRAGILEPAFRPRARRLAPGPGPLRWRAATRPLADPRFSELACLAASQARP